MAVSKDRLSGVEVSIGNHKIGLDTMILNMESATDCISKLLGLCQLPDNVKCYAEKAEVQYPDCLPYRRRQELVWASKTADEIADGLIRIATRRRKVKIRYMRFSESGDFVSQGFVDKMSRIANRLAEIDVKVYGYTARRDFDFLNVSDNMTVNGSGFMVHNSYSAVENAAEYVGQYSAYICPGDCRKCGLCKTSHGRKIVNQYH